MARIINLRNHPDILAALEAGHPPENVVRIDRETDWGNPFVLDHDGDRATVIAQYRTHLWERLQNNEIDLPQLAALNDKTLACWCHPNTCHGDILATAASWATNQIEKIQETQIQQSQPITITPTDLTTDATPTLTFAGIGARETPPVVLQNMAILAEWLTDRGWHLHSGGAAGADTAFANATPLDQRSVFLPWPNYNELQGPDTKTLPPDLHTRALSVAAALHPDWQACSHAAQNLHARNVPILLGPDLSTPVNAVICWTEQGQIRGGTAMGIRIARSRDIPVFNLAIDNPRDVCKQLIAIENQTHRTMAPTVPPTVATTTVTHHASWSEQQHKADTVAALLDEWHQLHETAIARHTNAAQTPGYDDLIASARALAPSEASKAILATHEQLLDAWQRRLGRIEGAWQRATEHANGISPYYEPTYPNLCGSIRQAAHEARTLHLPPDEKYTITNTLKEYLNHHQNVKTAAAELSRSINATSAHAHADKKPEHANAPNPEAVYGTNAWANTAKRFASTAHKLLATDRFDFQAHLAAAITPTTQHDIATPTAARLERVLEQLETRLHQNKIEVQRTHVDTTPSLDPTSQSPSTTAKPKRELEQELSIGY